MPHAVGTNRPFAWRDVDWLYEHGTNNPLGWFQGGTFYQYPGGKALYLLGELVRSLLSRVDFPGADQEQGGPSEVRIAHD